MLFLIIYCCFRWAGRVVLSHARRSPTSVSSPVLPFECAYLVIPGRLLMGYVPVKPEAGGTHQQVRALLGQGIRVFINLMHDDEENYDGAIIPGYEQELREESAALGVAAYHYRLSIADLSVPTPGHMVRVLGPQGFLP